MSLYAMAWFSISFMSLFSLGSVLSAIVLVLSGKIDNEVASAMRERKAAEMNSHGTVNWNI